MGMFDSIREAITGMPSVETKKKPTEPKAKDMTNAFATQIDTWQSNAEGGSRPTVERVWDDEEKIYIGDQWSTSIAPRSAVGRERNFNSQDNLVLPTIQNITAALTGSSPTFEFDPMEPNDAETTSLMTDFIPAILAKNQFQKDLKTMILQFVKHGPLICSVEWDPTWIGGSGPNRWVGDINIIPIKKSEFYPDPAIIDLEYRLQDCEFINRKFRMKLADIASTWPETGDAVSSDSMLPAGVDEGADPNQAWVIACWHKGTPQLVPEYWQKRFNELADEADSQGLPYAAQDYRDMASGKLKGVHVAYKADSTLLEYVPYVYDDGDYPFVFRVLYADEKQPMGMGEVRNLMIPQILHNKADEIELGGMAAEGLGGAYYKKGSIDKSQLNSILAHNSKPGALHEVNDPSGLLFRTGVRVPPSITNYKEHKQRIIDTVSQNTAIQQGISPGANVPYATVEALGARADVRTKAKIEIIEDFLKEVGLKIIKRAGQFYTEKRMFRITGERQEQAKANQVYGVMKQIAMMPPGTPPDLQMQAMVELLTIIKTVEPKKTFEFGRADLMRSWTRDTVSSEAGVIEQKEEFIPEFDLKVKIGDERPTDRNYYTNIAMGLLGKGMGLKAFWKTIDDGKFPPIDDILQELDQQQQAAQQQMMQQKQEQMTQQPIPGR